MPDTDEEIERLQEIYAAFSQMPTDAARDRALWWLKERHDWDMEQRRRAAQPASA